MLNILKKVKLRHSQRTIRCSKGANQEEKQFSVNGRKIFLSNCFNDRLQNAVEAFNICTEEIYHKRVEKS